MGVRRRPGTASGAAADSPLPGAPSGDPTPITQSVADVANATGLRGPPEVEKKFSARQQSSNLT